MSTVLETERLVLRPIENGDAAAIAAYLNDFDVVKNLAPVPWPYTEEMADEFIARSRKADEAGELGRFVVLLAGGPLIGWCGATEDEASPGAPLGAPELGYWFGKAHWGQGYATEAARAVVSFAFGDASVRALTSGYFVDNPASGRVLSKLGFRRVAQVERPCLSRGCTVTSNRVLLRRDDYEVAAA